MRFPGYRHFVRQHWLKSPMHVSGGQVGLPLSAPETLGILVAASDRYRRDGSATIRCYTSREVNPLPFLACGDDDSIAGYVRRVAAEAGQSSFTLILNSCQSYDFDLWDRLRTFMAPLVEASGVCVESDAAFYLSRTDKTVFGIHSEPYENLIFQLEGRKRFHLWPPDYALPAEKLRATTYDDLLGDAMNVTLSPGDFLYVPNGWYHVADTEPGELSVHLSLNLNTDQEGILRLVRAQATRQARSRLARGLTGGGAFAAAKSTRASDITLPTGIARMARAFESLELGWPVTTSWMRVLSGAGFADVATIPEFDLTDVDVVAATRPDAILSASQGEEAACAVNGTLIQFPASEALFGLIRRLNRGKPAIVGELLDEFSGERDDMVVERDALRDLLIRIGRAHGLKKS